MKEVLEKHLVQFNDYWIENMHSRIQTTTSQNDNADNIQNPNLEFLTDKTSLFLLSQFQEIYRKNEETNLISKMDITSMLTGYNTSFPPLFNNNVLNEDGQENNNDQDDTADKNDLEGKDKQAATTWQGLVKFLVGKQIRDL
ncbi:12108_t:CDS:2, partial [Funneliformis geosporum]